jgi:hypothetical protein
MYKLNNDLVKEFKWRFEEYFDKRDFKVKQCVETGNAWLFVNMNNTHKYSGIDIYRYPVNEYFESYFSMINLTDKSFWRFIDENVYFENGEPFQKKSPIITNKYIPQLC